MHNLGASIKLIGGNVRQSKLRKKPQDLNWGGGSSYLILLLSKQLVIYGHGVRRTFAAMLFM